jgi:lysozyme
MQLSNKGEAIVKNFEGLRLDAYCDSAGVWTIGYGSTRYPDDKPVRSGDKIENELQADELFRETLTQYVNAVNNGVHVPLTQNQFDALVSITYNEGAGIMQGSSLVRLLNEKNYAGAADQFLVWNKITNPNTGQKITSPTLVARRQEERQLFLTA